LLSAEIGRISKAPTHAWNHKAAGIATNFQRARLWVEQKQALVKDIFELELCWVRGVKSNR
jgi:hypothetical protein